MDENRDKPKHVSAKYAGALSLAWIVLIACPVTAATLWLAVKLAWLILAP